MSDEEVVTAAILGELVPQLEYAAPKLLERYHRGEPLVAQASRADLGFEGGLDPVLLEFFKALVPCVEKILGWGTLGVVQTWIYRRGTYGDLVVALKILVAENEKLRQILERVAELQGERQKTLVSSEDVLESIAEATYRVGTRDDGRPR